MQGTILLRLWSAYGGSIRAAAEVSRLLCEWKSQRCVGLMVFAVWQLNRSFTHQINKRSPTLLTNPQSNVTGPGSVLETYMKTLHPYMEKPLSSCLSSCLSSWLPSCLSNWLFVTFLPEKQCLSPATEPGSCMEQKKFNSPCFCGLPLLCCCNYCLFCLFWLCCLVQC